MSKIKKVIRQALATEKAAGISEISLCVTDDKLICRLNKKYFGRNRPTDVIAFSTGDIAVSADTATNNAVIFNTHPLYELLLYAAHGALHVIGYDDKTAGQRKVMDQKAGRILKKAGINKCPSIRPKRS
ncbi:MAG: rRNA maturation RNase YbeY [Candidatus Omnitrophota bacterium]